MTEDVSPEPVPADGAGPDPTTEPGPTPAERISRALGVSTGARAPAGPDSAA